MTQLCILQPIQDAISYTATPLIDSARYSSIVVSADHLAGAETVPIYVNVGGTLKPLIDDDGVAQTLTATVYMKRLLGGPTYVFGKDETVTATGIYLDFCA